MARQHHARLQPALCPVVLAEIATVGAGDVARDPQTNAGAAVVLAARAPQAVEGLEEAFQLRLRDAGAVVFDADAKLALAVDDRDEFERRRRDLAA